MGTLKPTSHILLHKKTLRCRRLLVLIPFVLALLFGSFLASKHLYPHQKPYKDLKSDIKDLEKRLAESQREVRVVTNRMIEYQDALLELKDDVKRIQHDTSKLSMMEAKEVLDRHEDRLDSLMSHVMVMSQDIYDIRRGSSLKDILMTEAQQKAETDSVKTDRENNDAKGSLSQWKKDISEAVKESFSKGKEMTKKAVEKAKETTKVIGQKMEQTGSMIGREVSSGARKTKEFIVEKGQNMKITMSSIGDKVKDASAKVKEQTKMFSSTVKVQAENMVKKAKDWKDSFMKMFR